ncbi:DeoR/GlpR family DNA-binding transcription regulator [Desulfopila inferna]|uniref:DeoR/GlpR family DNA-binding transcription regulator n=1 Tax=Desulfopila inferna TaxID=468528 RepID=UPI00196229DF|nr:DeoR/GlpR family DNA-binding transcription regulator [Desulfopila inferna]MBM9603857.1 DeoR/GlpR transcriptional regulator [Desulfopila inferna]
MEIISERQKHILHTAKKKGRVNVDQLAAFFRVSPQTIRKDLNELCNRQLLQRVHGGAIIGSSIENVSYEARKLLAPQSKKAIGKRAAQLIPDNCSLFINIGTTTEQVAMELTSHRGLMAITNNIKAIDILRSSPGIELIIAGGLVRRSDGGIVGVAAVDFINQFKVDYAIIGVSGIDEDGLLLDYDLSEVRVAQAIIANSRHVIMVADMMKFNRNAPVRIGHISQIDTLVIDGIPSKKFRDLCQEHEVVLEIAEPG